MMGLRRLTDTYLGKQPNRLRSSYDYLSSSRKYKGSKGKDRYIKGITLYSIMYPRSSDLCSLFTCLANCSTGTGGWSASLLNSPGTASTFLFKPETQQTSIGNVYQNTTLKVLNVGISVASTEWVFHPPFPGRIESWKYWFALVQ